MIFLEKTRNKGGFEIIFEDKDDKLEIERALNDFWKTWSNQILLQYEKDS